MPKVLTKNQIEQFYTEGFLSPIDVMSEDEALAYRQRLEDAERNHPKLLNPNQRSNVHLAFMFADELVHNQIILDAVEDLIGADISFWATVLFIKEPSTNHYVSWHQDATYMYMNQNNFVTPWLALSPSNLETGCMSMIPESHKQHILEHEDTFAENNILTRGQVIRNVDESKAVNLILRPGQMSIHNGEIVHGSQPNHSNDRRIGFAMQSYMPPTVNQTLAKNYWMHIRGKQRSQADTIFLPRPRYDLDPVSLANLELANQNLADILYHGAEKKRSY